MQSKTRAEKFLWRFTKTMTLVKDVSAELAEGKVQCEAVITGSCGKGVGCVGL